MKSYSAEFDVEGCACARAEGVDASWRDLGEVCGRIRGKDAGWALVFLEKAARMEIPVLYKRHCRKLGHRREISGKGRYPWKAAKAVLKALKSALANGKAKGLGTDYVVLHVASNRKETYPRIAAKGRRFRQNFTTSRIEVVVKSRDGAPRGVEARKPVAAEKVVVGSKKQEAHARPKEQEKTAASEKKSPEAKPPAAAKDAGHGADDTGPAHTHDAEKTQQEKERKGIPHQHGEHKG